ncbi:preprotein translocase subunit SecG [Halodesulfovibrio sp.]|uniref:preprotein translocase subunit SecG n=1 Tax=Halodesulfovibrio sp. TaxID=1912772 RepID=UPI0025F58CB8|nr:preprotein translocase subunit SecG [Halodesulfovibrio sp.]MCT4534945.1 preprotein translocase subunit SecG [Halodesulfovibrio sp.]MCT4627742.1 preprotein translocase subunit SecG [Halodesulfovibrio sp.]
METLILTLHVVVCLALILLVLLQAGKEGMGVIFGGGNQSAFGGAGAGGLLVKVTATLAAIFFITSLSYNYIAGDHVSKESSIMDIQIEQKAQPSPDQTEK